MYRRIKELPPSEQEVLVQLKRKGEAAAVDISNSLYTEPTRAHVSKVSVTLKRLEKKGFVTRKEKIGRKAIYAVRKQSFSVKGVNLKLFASMAVIFIALALAYQIYNSSTYSPTYLAVANMTGSEAGVYSVVTDAEGKVIGASAVFTAVQEESALPLAEMTVSSKEVYDVDISLVETPVKSIHIKNFVAEDTEKFIRVDDTPETGQFVETYAIDPTAVVFESAEVVVTAKGDELFKCKDWNFDERACYGDWTKIMDITPGQDYTFTLTAEDPAYGETIQPNATYGKDSYIVQSAANTNYGTSTYMGIDTQSGGNERPILQFNISNIPSGSIINSAVLEIYQTIGGGSSFNASVRRILSDWTETQVTWNNRTNTSTWGTAGGNYSSTDYANVTVGTSSGVFVRWNITTLVQQWFNGTYPNYGLILVSPSSGLDNQKRFASSDNTNETIRPKLTINYTYGNWTLQTNMGLYAPGEDVLITGYSWSPSTDITLDIKFNGNSLSGYPTNVLSTPDGNISNTLTLNNYAGQGNYTILAYETAVPTKNNTAMFEVARLYRYEPGTLLIPMDSKQSTNNSSLNFLRAYGMIWRFANNSISSQMVITPPCYKINATNINTSVNYSEDYCHGFFLINNPNAWTYLNTLRSYQNGTTYPFANVTVHNVTSPFIIREDHLFSIPTPPRVAVLSGSEAEIVPSLNPSYIPYTLLNSTQIKSGILVPTTYDVLAIGHLSITDANLSQYIKNFVIAGGNVHAECIAATTLDSYTAFYGNVEGFSNGGNSGLGDMRILNETSLITQTHVIDAFDNEGGIVPVLNVTNVNRSFGILAVDENYNTNHNLAKLIETYYGNGYVTYAGGHMGDITGGLETPRNRILDNIVFWAIEVNDIIPPKWVSQNQSKNITNSEGLIYAWANWYDNVRLDTAILSHNGTGTWQNVSLKTLVGDNDISNFSISTIGLIEGTIGWRIYANDTKNNWNSTNITTFVYDNIKPVINFVAPTNQSGTSVKRDWIAANVTITEANPQNFTYYLYNGTALINSTTFTGQSNAINFTGLPDGIYYYNVTAVDKAGNTNTSETRTIILDSIAPTIQPVSPTDTPGSYLNRTFLRVNVTGTDANLINITIRLYNSTSLINTSTTGAPNFANFTGLPDGIYYYNATAYDAAGNSNGTITYNFTIDTTKPSIQLVSPTPANGSYNTNKTISVTASDTNLDTIQIFVNGTIVKNCTGIPCEYGLTQDGNFTFYVIAKDKAGNTNTSETRSIVIDTQVPLWSSQLQNASTPMNGSTILLSTYWTDFNLSYAILSTNESGVWENKTVYGSPLELIGSANWTNFTWKNDSVVPGTVVGWIIYANDSVGNWNATDVMTFTVTTDSEPPTITLTYLDRLRFTNQSVEIKANVTDDYGVSNVWFNITYPNSTTITVIPNLITGLWHYNFTDTFQNGDYNLSIYATDNSGNLASLFDHFSLYVPINVSINVTDANSTDLDANITLYLPGTDYEVDTENITGNYTGEVPSYLYDILLVTYNDTVTLLTRDTNITANTTNLYIIDSVSMSVLLGINATAIPNISVYYGVAIEALVNFGNATLNISYANLSVANESNLRVWKCEDWNITARVCEGTWENATYTVDMVSKIVSIFAPHFTMYLIGEPTLFLAQTGGGIYGGGGGDGGGVTFPPSLNVTSATGCEQCPEPLKWSECSGGRQSRTDWFCAASTNYTCQELVETRACLRMPVILEGILHIREVSLEFILIIIGIAIVLIIAFYIVYVLTGAGRVMIIGTRWRRKVEKMKEKLKPRPNA